MHAEISPSDWIYRWSSLLEPGSHVLDVACGHGRHMRLLHTLGHKPTGVDISHQAVEAARQWGDVTVADLENGPWPFSAPGAGANVATPFDAVVVCNYLWRPLMPVLLDSVRTGGLLLYETFAVGNELLGKPSRPDFLLKPGELLAVCEHMKVIAYEDVRLNKPARLVQRIVAQKL